MNAQTTGQCDYDVVIVGGGTAGVVAAIQAGRAGAKTLLVEKNGMLGGTMTMGGINFPGLFFAWGRQVIAGIGWELVLRCLEECGESLPMPNADLATQHHKHHIHIDRFVYAALCDAAVLEAGADLLFHTMIAGATPHAEGWQVTLCTKTGLEMRTARVLIDCTGDANVVSLAGLPLNIPDECQPATLSCHASGYDYETLDIPGLDQAVTLAVQQGTLQFTDAGWKIDRANVDHWLRYSGENANHIHHINARDSAGKSRMEVEARRSFLRLYRFLRTQPGLEQLHIDFMAPECGIRETATIVGQTTVTVEDYCSGRVWDDTVCYSFYPIDLHVSSERGVQKESLKEGIVPTIPRGAMLPLGSRNLIVAGRCIASDRLANSALRVQATAMATGQAAGVMAALAAASGTAVHALPISDIHHLLHAHGAIVPDLAATPV